jgi:flavin reductase (DIM6/NTAB) family NADH-FMN oxidoreductase RutF
MIRECPLNIECRTWKIIEVGSHHLFIGDVVAAHINENALNAEGEPDLAKMALFTYNPLVSQYWAVNEFLRNR